MKELFFTIIICCLLSGCSSQSPNKYISNEIGITIPSSIEIELTDTHGGFLGDGKHLQQLISPIRSQRVFVHAQL